MNDYFNNFILIRKNYKNEILYIKKRNFVKCYFKIYYIFSEVKDKYYKNFCCFKIEIFLLNRS